MHESIKSSEWGLWTKKFFVVLLFLGFVALTLFLGPVMQDIIVTLILVFLLSIPAYYLRKAIKMPYIVSVLLTLVGYFALISLFGIIIAEPVGKFVDIITIKIEEEAPKVIKFYQDYDVETAQNDTLRVINEPVSRLVKGETNQINQYVPDVVNTVREFFNGLINITTKFLLIHFLAILFLIELPRLFRGLKNAIPSSYKREYAILIKKIYQVCVAYSKSQLLIALILGFATFMQCYFLGIEGAVVIGVFAAIMALIPILGGLFILVPIFFIPLALGSSIYSDSANPTFNLLLAVVSLVINLLIQLVVWNIIAPKIAGDALSLPVSIIVVGIIVGSAVGGVLGAIVVVPLIAVSKIVIDYVLMKIRGGQPYKGESEPNFLDKKIF